VASFLSTNYGVAYQESYDSSNNLLGTDIGFFGIVSQLAGGNAPTNPVNDSLAFESMGAGFNLSLGAGTFALCSPTPAFDTGAGSFSYARTGTNVGQITLAYAAPLNLTGETTAASLMFIAPNLGVYTNADGTYGDVMLGVASGYAPGTLGGGTINITNSSNASLSQFSFATNGTFTLTGAMNDSGTYASSSYSPDAALVQLAVTAGDYAGSSGTLQLQYGSAGGGRYQLTILGPTNTVVSTSSGVFGQQ
jgi:hypothetical protein